MKISELLSSGALHYHTTAPANRWLVVQFWSTMSNDIFENCDTKFQYSSTAIIMSDGYQGITDN